MNSKQHVAKLENDLTNYMINEVKRNKRRDPKAQLETYKYKGLSMNLDVGNAHKEKTLTVRIGALEAEFKVSTGEKASGGLMREDENMIIAWMKNIERKREILTVFTRLQNRRRVVIIPFGLEEFYKHE